MLFQINFQSGLPVYLQLAEQVRAAAAAGALRLGEPLPGIRPLAEQLRINRNTVAKAYAQLEAQGVIETLPGKGCFLKAGQSRLKKSARHERLTAEIDQAIVAAHHLQVSRKDFLTLVADRLDHFAEQQQTHAEKDRP